MSLSWYGAFLCSFVCLSLSVSEAGRLAACRDDADGCYQWETSWNKEMGRLLTLTRSGRLLAADAAMNGTVRMLDSHHYTHTVYELHAILREFSKDPADESMTSET